MINFQKIIATDNYIVYYIVYFFYLEYEYEQFNDFLKNKK